MEKFSVYPAGVQGAALMALRMSLAFTLLSRPHVLTAGILTDIAVFAVAGILAIGGLVRIIALGAAALAMTDLLSPDLANAAHLLDATSVAILGPGAYSLDARAFGRRVIRIGRRKLPSLPDPDG